MAFFDQIIKIIRLNKTYLISFIQLLLIGESSLFFFAVCLQVFQAQEAGTQGCILRSCLLLSIGAADVTETGIISGGTTCNAMTADYFLLFFFLIKIIDLY